MPLEHRIRVLLAEANPTFLDAAARFLVLDANLALVGRAVTGADTLHQAADLAPDLVLVDIALRDMNSLAVVRQIKGWPEPPRVVVLALNDGVEYLEAARHAGADGFVAKMEFYSQMNRLINAWHLEPAEPDRLPASPEPNGTAA